MVEYVAIGESGLFLSFSGFFWYVVFITIFLSLKGVQSSS